MSPLFGKKQPEGKTILLLDVENGSVGSVFVHLSPTHAPRLFGEVRERIRILPSRDAHALAHQIERAMERVLKHASEVAARIRLTKNVAGIGNIERGAIFLRAPWVHIDFDERGTPTTNAVEDFLRSTIDHYRGVIGDSPLTFHSFGVSTGPILHSLFALPEESLICIMGSEVTELFITDAKQVYGYATLPIGVHTIIRTLKTHSNLSEAEIYSLIQLPNSTDAEALHVSALHLLREFASAAHALFPVEPLRNVFVVADEPFADWFARALGSEDLHEVFSEGGEVRAVCERHITPYLAAHAQKPDVPLMLASLFADARFSAV